MAAVLFAVHLQDAPPDPSLGGPGRALGELAARKKVVGPVEDLTVEAFTRDEQIAVAAPRAGHRVLDDAERPELPMQLDQAQ